MCYEVNEIDELLGTSDCGPNWVYGILPMDLEKYEPDYTRHQLPYLNDLQTLYAYDIIDGECLIDAIDKKGTNVDPDTFTETDPFTLTFPCYPPMSVAMRHHWNISMESI